MVVEIATLFVKDEAENDFTSGFARDCRKRLRRCTN